MPAASSMIAANYVFTVAKPDGLTLGWIAPTLYFDHFVGRKEVQYDRLLFSKGYWKKPCGRSLRLFLAIKAEAPSDLAVEKGEIHCRAMTTESFFAREPFNTWRKNNFVKSIAQSGDGDRQNEKSTGN
jgi:hypothetical protein